MNRFCWLFIALLSGTLGCRFDHDDHDQWYGGSGPICGSQLEGATIDPNEPLVADPGEGVGVFVEYQGDGRWSFFTTCDTAQSDYECYFDIVVAPIRRDSLLGVLPDGLERDDSLELIGQNSVQFLSWTSTDTDGFLVDSEPGMALQIDLLLDGECANPYLYWFGDGAIHRGAPSNPFELEPLEP